MDPSVFDFQDYSDDGSANVFRPDDDEPGRMEYVASVDLSGPEPMLRGLCIQDWPVSLRELAALVVATTEHVKKVVGTRGNDGS